MPARHQSPANDLDPGTSYVQQMALRVVHIVEIRFIGNLLDAFLEWDYLVVTSHHHNSAELQAFRQMHCADGNMPAHCLHIFI